MQTHYHSRDVNTQLEGEARKQDSAQSTYAAAEKNNLILIDLEQVEMSSLAFVVSHRCFIFCIEQSQLFIAILIS